MNFSRSMKRDEHTIGMILDQDFPPDPRVENEITFLLSQGFNVKLFSLNYKGKSGIDRSMGFEVHRYALPPIMRKFAALAYTVPVFHFFLKKKIVDFLGVANISVIHTHDMLTTRAVFWANRNFQKPIVVDLHENRPEIMKFYGYTQTLSGRLLINTDDWKKWQRRIMQSADRVIVITPAAKKVAVETDHITPEKIFVVPNTVKASFFDKPVLDQALIDRFKDRFCLLYVGDTGLRRGLESVILAVKKLKEDIPEILLVIVGKSMEDPVLKKLAVDSGVEGHVSFEGWQDMALFPSYIMASDICISPLKRNLHHDTTYANKVFQYMSLQRAVLVSDCTAQQEIVEEHETGLVHKAEDVKDISRQILRLYQDQDLREKLAKNGERFVKEVFTWEKQAHALIKLYEGLELNS